MKTKTVKLASALIGNVRLPRIVDVMPKEMVAPAVAGNIIIGMTHYSLVSTNDQGYLYKVEFERWADQPEGDEK